MPELVEERDIDDDVVTPEERKEAIKLITRVVAAGLAVLLAGGVAVLLNRNDDKGFGGDVTLINAIGPLSGRNLTTYTLDRRKELLQASGSRAAVISFDKYLTEADARRLVQGVVIKGLMVAPPGSGPGVVEGALAEWAERARAAAAEERAQFEQLLPTYDPKEDGPFIDDAKAKIALLTRVEQTAKADGDVVFGVVVVGGADNLRRLANTTGVRLVDIGASAGVPAASRIRGVRPEEAGLAGEPLTRPA
jgi:hypothetical protein